MIDTCLTVVVPVKNEVKNLPACLENIKGLSMFVSIFAGSHERTL